MIIDNVEIFRTFCLSKAGVTEELPFDEHTLVFKVMGKMFALTSLNSEEFKINLKCNPEKSLELRADYDAIQPGYHMSKKHWNTITIDNTLPNNLLKDLIDHSYALVVDGLTKKLKSELKNLASYE